MPSAPVLTEIERHLEVAFGCECCDRAIKDVYVLSDGQRVGRRCAVRITGWKKPEAALRIAEVARRRQLLCEAGVTSEHAIGEIGVADFLWRSDEAWRTHGWVTGETPCPLG